jgi:hypothetical protein
MGLQGGGRRGWKDHPTFIYPLSVFMVHQCCSNTKPDFDEGSYVTAELRINEIEQHKVFLQLRFSTESPICAKNKTKTKHSWSTGLNSQNYMLRKIKCFPRHKFCLLEAIKPYTL